MVHEPNLFKPQRFIRSGHLWDGREQAEQLRLPSGERLREMPPWVSQCDMLRRTQCSARDCMRLWECWKKPLSLLDRTGALGSGFYLALPTLPCLQTASGSHCFTSALVEQRLQLLKAGRERGLGGVRFSLQQGAYRPLLSWRGRLSGHDTIIYI